MVDNQGNFVPVAGHTVICMLSPTYRFYNRMCAIEDLIETTPVLRKYMRPLPSSSYHMTVYGIPRVSSPPGYELSPQLEIMDKLCDRKIIGDVSVKITGVYIGETPGISFSVGADVIDLRDLLARKFVESSTDYIFHMTFAYIFRPLEKEDIEEYTEEITKLKKYIFDSCVNKKGIIIFSSPRVYSYNNMSSFKPLKDG